MSANDRHESYPSRLDIKVGIMTWTRIWTALVDSLVPLYVFGTRCSQNLSFSLIAQCLIGPSGVWIKCISNAHRQNLIYRQAIGDQMRANKVGVF